MGSLTHAVEDASNSNMIFNKWLSELFRGQFLVEVKRVTVVIVSKL